MPTSWIFAGIACVLLAAALGSTVSRSVIAAMLSLSAAVLLAMTIRRIFGERIVDFRNHGLAGWVEVTPFLWLAALSQSSLQILVAVLNPHPLGLQRSLPSISWTRFWSTIQAGLCAATAITFAVLLTMDWNPITQVMNVAAYCLLAGLAVPVPLAMCLATLPRPMAARSETGPT